MVQRPATINDGTRGVRALLASANPRMRAWAQDVLPAHVTICAFADDSSLIAELARAKRADVCLLDLRLPGDPLAALTTLVKAAPAVRIVAWADSDDDTRLVEAVDAGASGCIVGEPDRDALARALADVLAGQPALPRAVVARLVAQLRLD
jgi:DNA-binding NarL/FixJ family response regulator